jgi:hypothetical protein
MPNLFLDITSKLARIVNKTRDAPCQGIETFESDVMLKVNQGPFKVVSQEYHALGSSAILPAKPNVRYLIHSITGHIVHDGTAAVVTLEFVDANGATQFFYRKDIFAPDMMTQVFMVNADTLLPPNTALTMKQATAAVQYHSLSVTYAEVLDV